MMIDNPCRPPPTDTVPEICDGLGILPLNTSVVPPTSKAVDIFDRAVGTAVPAEPLCQVHAADKALLSAGPGADGATEQPGGPLFRPGMDYYLRTNRDYMCELYEAVSNYNELPYIGEEECLPKPDILPNTNSFTPLRRNRARLTNRSQLLYDHVSLIAGFIRALDTLRQDQDQLPMRRLRDSTIENTMHGMCRLLYEIHRVLRICDFDVEELQRIHTTPSVDYEPPQRNFHVHVRDFVIVHEAYLYVKFAHYDLSGLLASNSTDCSSIAPLDLQATTQTSDDSD